MVSRCGRTPGCVPGRVNVPRCGAIAVAGMLCAMAAPGAEAASCAFGGSSEVSLQSVLNAITSTGTIDAGAGCVADGADAYWSTIGSTGSDFTRRWRSRRRSSCWRSYSARPG